MENKPANTQIFRYSLNFFLFFLFFTLSLAAWAQQTVYSSTDKKAIKDFEEAKALYEGYDLKKAAELLEESIERDANFAEAYTLLGYVYIDLGDYGAARKNLRKSVELQPMLFVNNYYILGELALQKGEYEAARNDFLIFEQSNPQNQRMLERSRRGRESANFAMEAMKKPVDFDPKNLGPNINSELAEYFPSLTVDGATLLFTRRLTGPDFPQGFNEDFFVSEKVGEEWQKAMNLGSPINTIQNEGAPTLAADGQTLIFTACEFYGDYGEKRKGFGSCDLFYTYKIGKNWDEPKNLGQKINTNNWETQPSFSADGKTLYFIRGIRSRTGARLGDIYTSRLDNRGAWSLPEALSSNVNTEGNEESVFIHPDGKTLYFSSDGHIGMGGLDIYVTRKNERGEWSDPQNLGYPINTYKSENSLLISADGSFAYFASDRDQGYGDLDLYSFELPKELRPEKVNYFAGKIFDKISKEPLMARFELIDLATGETVIESYSNAGNGQFLVTLPPNRDYALNASKDGYLFYSENFSLSSNENKAPERKDIPLQPIKVGEKIVLKNIFFETGKYSLKDASKVELSKLVEFLEKNPQVKIEVSGHTDHVGKDEDNLLLSQNRANSVVSYLTANGISASRLSSKGYGESQPIGSNETAEGRAANRRTEFKIVGM